MDWSGPLVPAIWRVLSKPAEIARISLDREPSLRALEEETPAVPEDDGGSLLVKNAHFLYRDAAFCSTGLRRKSHTQP